MHRIDTDTAQADKFGAGKNGFTGGNPQTGRLPTALDEDFFDAVQEELCSVIEGAGITPVKGSNGQVLAALKALLQPLNDNLTAFAGLAGETNKMAYFTVAKTLALTSLTSVGRDIIAKASVADILAYLGLNTAATRAVGSGVNQIPDMSYFNSSPAYNGYQVFPGGIIMQWGQSALSNASTQTITFPIQFPSNCFNVVGMIYDDTNPVSASLRRKSSTTPRATTQFFVSNATTATSINWIAFGI